MGGCIRAGPRAVPRLEEILRRACFLEIAVWLFKTGGIVIDLSWALSMTEAETLRWKNQGE